MRGVWQIATAFTAAGVLAIAGAPGRAENPNGFLQSDLWACLLPLDGSDCTGGGETALRGNWLDPRSPALENPVIGTVWDDVATGEDAKSGGYLGRGSARFRNVPARGDPDAVDLGAYLAAQGLPRNFVLAVAATYVENTTGAPLPVGLCTASDDSIQVWINNSLVVSRSVCRPLDAGCAQIDPSVLAPGINRILVLLWQGIGEFGFRVGFTHPDGFPYTQEDREIRYLGAGDASGAVGPLPLLARSWEGSEILRPEPDHAVVLRGDGSFVPDALYSVQEDLAGAVSLADISGVSNGGRPALLPSRLPVAGIFRHTVVGIACGNPNGTTSDGDVYATTATTGADIWADGDDFEFAFQQVRGDFDVVVEIVAKEFPPTGRWGKFGIMARQDLERDARYGMIQDHGPDPTDAARYARRRIQGQVLTVEEPATTETLSDPNTAEPLLHPRFLRLTRRDGGLQGWVSQTAGEAGYDPRLDDNWRLVYTDAWTDAPADLSVGFAYSVHNSSGCATGTIHWRPLVLDTQRIPPPPDGVRILWDVRGSVLNGKGLRYAVSGQRGTQLQVAGHANGAFTRGPGLLAFQASTGDRQGIFDSVSDIGAHGPCTPGSLTALGGGRYTLAASGRDIWTDGDQFTFAYTKVTGDFVLEAEFADVNPPAVGGRWGKYGLMVRWDCRPDAAYFFAHNAAATDMVCEVDGPRTALRPQGGASGGNLEPNGYWWQDIFGDEPLSPSCDPVEEDPRANDLRGDSRNAARFLRIVRRAGAFYGYGSSDGDRWYSLGAHSWIDPPATLLAGVAATSHADCGVMEVTFADVFLGPLQTSEEKPENGRDDDPGTLLAGDDFDEDPDGSCPQGWRCNSWGTGTFDPQTAGGRLRLADLAGSPRGDGLDRAASAFLQEVFDAGKAYRFEFDIFFRYDLDATADGPPGDGLTFCVLGTRRGLDILDGRVGDRGGGLGYQRINLSLDERRLSSKETSSNSFAVEFDTWYNGETWNEGDGANVSGWDPSGGRLHGGTGAYHVGLDVNASTASVQRSHQMGIRDEELPDIFDPEGIHARVEYAPGRVKVWIQSNEERDEDDDGILVIDAPLEPLSLNADQIIVGFTAATGSATCTMEVDGFSMRELPENDGGALFHRGDANDDGALNITDAIFVLNFLFTGGAVPPCLDAADANGDENLDISDAVYALDFLFLGGLPPRPPGPPKAPCGPDPRGPTKLGCERYTSCFRAQFSHP